MCNKLFRVAMNQQGYGGAVAWTAGGAQHAGTWQPQQTQAIVSPLQQQMQQFHGVQQQHDTHSQLWAQQHSEYESKLGYGGYQEADPNNPYQQFLKQQNLDYWTPQSYEKLLQDREHISSINNDLQQQQSSLQQQLSQQHQAQYYQQFTKHLQQTQQAPSYVDRYAAGAQKFQRQWDQMGGGQGVQRFERMGHGQDAQTQAAQAVFGTLDTRNPNQRVSAPGSYEEWLAQQKAMGLIPQWYGDQTQKPAEIDFHKLSPTIFQKYVLYYRQDCPYSINLLSQLAKDPSLDAQVSKYDINKVYLNGVQLRGVPTLIDNGRQFLGDDALRWVNAKSANDVVGMDVQDVGALDMSGASLGDESFSFVNESLLNMPQIHSLDAIDTRQQSGPTLDNLLQMVDSQRKTFLQPYGDTGALTPVPQAAPQAYAQAQADSDRPMMNHSQRQNMNATYDLNRSAFFGQ